MRGTTRQTLVLTFGQGLNITHYVLAKHLALQDEQRQRVNQYLNYN
jgi:hypothetical protein